MKTIVLASGNKDKLKEIKEILVDFNVISCKEAGFNEEIVEDGNSFYENALIKAKTVALALNMPALADDSGICVEALNGEPGIYSARYAGDGNDEHNNELLLKNLKGKSNRKAKYVCSMVYYNPNGEIVCGEGEMAGEILEKPVGNEGFGYDPIFYSYDLNECMGLVPAEKKNTVSHRFRAIKSLLEKLK